MDGFDGIVPQPPSGPRSKTSDAPSLKDRLIYTGRELLNRAPERRRPGRRIKPIGDSASVLRGHPLARRAFASQAEDDDFSHVSALSHFTLQEARPVPPAVSAPSVALQRVLPRINAVRAGSVSNASGVRRAKSSASSFGETFSQATQATAATPYLYLKANSQNPYSLSSVAHSGIGTGGDFYLCSSSGLVHSEIGGATEFTSRSDYARESQVYFKLRQIRFFAQFRWFRAFHGWRKATLSRKRARVTKVLQAELFMLHSRHRDCLLQLRWECTLLWDQRLFDVEPAALEEDFEDAPESRLEGQNAPLEGAVPLFDAPDSTASDSANAAVEKVGAFSDRQSRRREAVGSAISQRSTAAHALVLKCCEDSLQSFLEDCGFGSGSVARSTAGEYTRRAAMRAHCQKLVKFVKLADLQLFQVHLDVAQASLDDLVRSCQRADAALDSAVKEKMALEVSTRTAAAGYAASPRAAQATRAALAALAGGASSAGVQVAVFDAIVLERVQGAFLGKGASTALVALAPPLLRVGVVVHGDRAALTPSRTELASRVHSLVDDALAVMATPAQLLRDSAFAPFVAALGENAAACTGPNLVEVLTGHLQFQKRLATLDACLTNAWDAAEAYASGFDPFLAASRDHEAARRRSAVDSPLASVCELETLLARYSTESRLFGCLPRSQRVGMLQIDSSQVTTGLEPSPLDCLETTRARAPGLYNAKAASLLLEFARQNEALSLELSRVDDYVVLRQTLSKAAVVLPQLQHLAASLEKVRNVMIGYGVDMEATVDSAILLNNLDASSRKSLLSATLAVEEQAEKFMHDLDRDALDVLDPVLKLKAELSVEFLACPGFDPGQALAHLARVQAEMQQVVDSCARVRKSQSVLGRESEATVEAAFDLKCCAVKLAHLKTLWRGAEGWRAQTAAWMDCACCDLDPAHLQSVVGDHAVALKASSDAMPGNEAAAAYFAISEDFALVVKLVGQLKSDHLEAKHYAIIEQVVGIKLWEPCSADSALEESELDASNAGQATTSGTLWRLSVKLGDLIQRHAIKFAATVEAIVLRAEIEAKLSADLADVVNFWEVAVLQSSLDATPAPAAARGSGSAPIAAFHGLCDLREACEADCIKLQALLGASFAASDLRLTILKWLRDLETASTALFDISRFQAKLRSVHALVSSSSANRIAAADVSPLFGGGNWKSKSEQARNKSFDAGKKSEADFHAALDFWRTFTSAANAPRSAIDLDSKMKSKKKTALDVVFSEKARRDVRQAHCRLDTAVAAMQSVVRGRKAAYPRLYLCSDAEVLSAAARCTLPYDRASPVRPIYARIFGVDAVDVADGRHSKQSKDVTVRHLNGDLLRLPNVVDFFKSRNTHVDEFLHALETALGKRILDGLAAAHAAAVALEAHEGPGIIPTSKSRPSDFARSQEDARNPEGGLEGFSDSESPLPGNRDALDAFWVRVQGLPTQCVVFACSAVWAAATHAALEDDATVENALSTLLLRRLAQVHELHVSVSKTASAEVRFARISLLQHLQHAVDSLDRLIFAKAQSPTHSIWVNTLKYRVVHRLAAPNSPKSNPKMNVANTGPPNTVPPHLKMESHEFGEMGTIGDAEEKRGGGVRGRGKCVSSESASVALQTPPWLRLEMLKRLGDHFGSEGPLCLESHERGAS
ncbi:hypothetical protein M885DRAFT_37045 [Pelagophyceae sp. CCMP2097]|nr:hypothetical protein M885DRAFT_37045 [Pelagophyceae sp. CCMP2097]